MSIVIIRISVTNRSSLNCKLNLYNCEYYTGGDGYRLR